MEKNYDYVIGGARSAGCTLAARLTEDVDVSVPLLEAGGWDRDPRLHIPLGWPRQLVRRAHDWIYFPSLRDPWPGMLAKWRSRDIENRHDTPPYIVPLTSAHRSP